MMKRRLVTRAALVAALAMALMVPAGAALATGRLPADEGGWGRGPGYGRMSFYRLVLSRAQSLSVRLRSILPAGDRLPADEFGGGAGGRSADKLPVGPGASD